MHRHRAVDLPAKQPVQRECFDLLDPGDNVKVLWRQLLQRRCRMSR